MCYWQADSSLSSRLAPLCSPLVRCCSQSIFSLLCQLHLFSPAACETLLARKRKCPQWLNGDCRQTLSPSENQTIVLSILSLWTLLSFTSRVTAFTARGASRVCSHSVPVVQETVSGSRVARLLPFMGVAVPNSTKKSEVVEVGFGCWGCNQIKREDWVRWKALHLPAGWERAWQAELGYEQQ